MKTRVPSAAQLRRIGPGAELVTTTSEEGEDAFWVPLGVLRKLTKTGNGTELDPLGCGFQRLSLWGRRDKSFSL